MRISDKVSALTREAVRYLPRPLVFTNGVFDILHRGHVTYLEAAREAGAALVVAVNSDTSVRSLNKGDNRPINRENDRALVLAGLASVDLVGVFNETTPLRVLAAIRPDIYVKGGDYSLDRLREAELVSTWGGTAMIIPFVSGYSTTSILARGAGE